MNLNKPVFLASSSDEASSQKKILEDKYGKNDFDNADVIVVLGGDGFMLEAIKSHMDKHLPIFGLNYGSVGFLMNSSNENDLINRINQSQSIKISPLMMKALSVDGSIHEAIAINEVSLLRETHQASKIKISVDGKVKEIANFNSKWVDCVAAKDGIIFLGSCHGQHIAGKMFEMKPELQTQKGVYALAG